ncbi:hypothetical protein HOL21_01255 [Candidatus Woesearchaeota archaeon]|jgi:Zn-dependent protease|nr:hypothetical protein [Candidatus Woesearchaeota archaeon]MBT5396820.1 hypothetical protein [Candidatus Woesearchaeota archaeon]MBT6367708.1 hypothetical protein [Candidatus Woesearchaeota archaeon]MBT7762891.1 hypothetical protein [Candidatus Woesearchaeota archaeon]
MANIKELIKRIQDFYRFSWQEISGLLIAVIFTAFIFSFRDWGGELFDIVIGLKNFVIVIFVAAISFTFRISCQKIYALSQGYKAEFKVWWVGLIIALVLAFISFGRVPLVLIGGVVTAFMVKQRLGEFRYGFSYLQNGFTSLWGILGNMILAIGFALGLYYVPQSYFFSKGLMLNVIMGFCALLPLPQLDGLNIYFGSRIMYYIAIVTVLLASVLLLTRTKWGLIIAIVIGSIAGIIYISIGSEK